MVDAGGVAAGKEAQRVGPSSGVGLDVARGQRMPHLYFPLPATAAMTTVLAGRTDEGKGNGSCPDSSSVSGTG